MSLPLEMHEFDPAEYAPRESHVGRRAKRAARERAVGLRALGVVVALVAVIVGARTLAGPALSRITAASQRQQATSSASRLTSQAFSSVPAEKPRATKPRGSAARSVASAGVTTPARHVSATAKTTAASSSGSGRAAVPAASRPALAANQRPRVAASSAKPRAPAHTPAKGSITIETFGYSFGAAPKGCRFVADVRNIPATGFSQSENGLMASVRARIMKQAQAKKWLATMETKWTPRLKAGDLLGIGCSRGHHRSVTLAYLYEQYLRAHGWKVTLVNRDIHKTW
jgi:hypothetical protein